MKVTKLGHCALVIEEAGAKILTDPGSYTIEQNAEQRELDAIVITHEHQDHFHIESIEALLKTNPQAVVISNASVAKLLQEKGIVCIIAGGGQSASVKGLSIEGFGTEHAEIYGMMGLVENTGYLIGDKLYFPGDNFHNPQKPVDTLALPVAGPWMKMSMAIDFAKDIKARTAFGVHDGMIIPPFRGFVHNALKMFVSGTQFVEIRDGETKEF